MTQHDFSRFNGFRVQKTVETVSFFSHSNSTGLKSGVTGRLKSSKSLFKAAS
jgi:hypothetical protein